MRRVFQSTGLLVSEGELPEFGYYYPQCFVQGLQRPALFRIAGCFSGIQFQGIAPAGAGRAPLYPNAQFCTSFLQVLPFGQENGVAAMISCPVNINPRFMEKHSFCCCISCCPSGDSRSPGQSSRSVLILMFCSIAWYRAGLFALSLCSTAPAPGIIDGMLNTLNKGPGYRNLYAYRGIMPKRLPCIEATSLDIV